MSDQTVRRQRRRRTPPGTRPAADPKPLVVDAALLLALGVVALLGFHSTFVGWSYLLAGGAGLVLGIALALLAHRLGQPVIVLVVLTVVAFFLLGGLVALHGLGGLSFLPVPDTLATLTDTAVNGWKELLTTLPPVDGGPLLTLPYLLGLVAGATGMMLAARLRWPVAPVLAPLALLAAVILLGVPSPERVAALGATFALLAIVWVVVRGRRLRTLRPGGHRLSRRITAVALCAGAVAIALAGSSALPGLGDDRVVLRSHVEPPFDVGQYPSPLAGFRVYTKGFVTEDPDRKLYDKELFTVSGLPTGSRVRIATLDEYDGTVWAAANDSGVDEGPADTYQKVGTTIANPTEGEKVTGTVTIGENFSGVWVPAPGALTGITFTRPDAQTGSEVFRYNLATSTGVLPSGLRPGDSYSFTAVLPDAELEPDAGTWSGATDADAGSKFAKLAADWSGDSGDPLEQVLAVADHMKRTGTYTDGEHPNERYPAGHSLRRLTDFAASGGQLAGDDEQYAALMAILANQLGVPARVVMGAEVGEDGVVRGKDVHAWVELRAGDGSWRMLDWPRFMSTDRKPQQESPLPERLVEGNVVPPPVPVRPPSTTGDPLDDSVNQKAQSKDEDEGASGLWALLLAILLYGGLPLLAIALVCAAIVGAKAWRRHRRRTRGDPRRRLASGWTEVLDGARDFGHTAPAQATRSEQAAALAADLEGLPTLALATDVRMFAAQPPTEESVAAYWAEVDGVRGNLRATHSRWQRIRAALNLATLRPRRSRRAVSRPQLPAPAGFSTAPAAPPVETRGAP